MARTRDARIRNSSYRDARSSSLQRMVRRCQFSLRMLRKNLNARRIRPALPNNRRRKGWKSGKVSQSGDAKMLAVSSAVPRPDAKRSPSDDARQNREGATPNSPATRWQAAALGRARAKNAAPDWDGRTNRMGNSRTGRTRRGVARREPALAARKERKELRIGHRTRTDWEKTWHRNPRSRKTHRLGIFMASFSG